MESAELNNTIIENDSIHVLSISGRVVARAGSGGSVSQSEIRSSNETIIEDNASNSGQICAHPLVFSQGHKLSAGGAGARSQP